MNELVSIIMPTFNREKKIRKAINSVRSQTYENWELIIVDNTHLHVKHKSFIPGKLHLHVKIKSQYLGSISKVSAQRLVMKALDVDLKTSIHALEISINK